VVDDEGHEFPPWTSPWTGFLACRGRFGFSLKLSVSERSTLSPASLQVSYRSTWARTLDKSQVECNYFRLALKPDLKKWLGLSHMAFKIEFYN
jgi:hypothetical protein